MTNIENVISLYQRKGYKKAPIELYLCPELIETYKNKKSSQLSYDDYLGISSKRVSEGILKDNDTEKFRSYYDFDLKQGTIIDSFGVAHEPGSESAKHMTYMRNPLRGCDSLNKMKEYPFPDFINASYEHQKTDVEKLHKMDILACGDLQCTIWETAWYIRGMEDLMMDMMTEDPMAEFILDKVTELSTIKALEYTKAGCDILFIGDDIGMQSSIMMSEQLYCDWIKPRLKKLINDVRKINSGIIIMYHTCGYVEPFIPHLIEVGIDVLNPVQPECMDFRKIHEMYGDKLSFNGTIGTQTTMPFGTPDDVRREVFKNLEIAGDKGGLLCCPTHLLEPEVPWENIEAYVKACKDFK